MVARRVCGVIAFTLAAGAWAAAPPDFQPVPAEVWSLTEADSQGTGAIILDRRLTYANDAFEYAYSIRILNEAGKGALALLTLPNEVLDLRGRTVTRDGQVFPFTDKKDLIKKNLSGGVGNRVQQTVVVPPGVTSDCVIEIAWRDPMVFRPSAFFGSTAVKHFQSMIVPLALHYPIRAEVVSIPDTFTYGWHLQGGSQRPEVAGSTVKTITYRNVPAMQTVPFLPEPARSMPRLTLYAVPKALQQSAGGGGAAFWAKAGTEFYRPLGSGVEVGRRYQAWAPELLKDLPATPQAAASELALRLEARIWNRDRPTFKEATALSKDEVREPIHPKNLDETVQRGRTNTSGMIHLYLQLLHDAGLPPAKLLLVADRARRTMEPEIQDVTQGNAFLVGVPEPGRAPLWVDLSLRFGAPGLIDAAYQGTRALCIDTGSWNPEFITVPIQPAASNLRSYTSRLEIGEEEDTFKLEAAFQGYPEQQARQLFMALPGEEQNRLLRDLLERQEEGFQPTRGEVLNATDPRHNVAWRAEGRREREPGRGIQVDPFPGVPLAVPVPRTWPERRSDPIVMPYLGILLAKASFRIPKGCRLLPQEPILHSNSFGRVAWNQEQTPGPDGPEAQVVMRVDVERLAAGPESYQELKDITAWVREARARMARLEKP